MDPPLDPQIDSLNPSWVLPALTDARAEDLLDTLRIYIVDRDAPAIHDVTIFCNGLQEPDFSGDTLVVECSVIPDENIPAGTVRFKLVPE